MHMCGANSSLKLLDQLDSALAPARDVVADVQHARRARCRGKQCVKRGDAPCIGGRNAEPSADVLEPRFADPANVRLERLQRGKEQVPLLARLPASMRDVRIAEVAAFAPIPR